MRNDDEDRWSETSDDGALEARLRRRFRAPAGLEERLLARLAERVHASHGAPRPIARAASNSRTSHSAARPTVLPAALLTAAAACLLWLAPRGARHASMEALEPFAELGSVLPSALSRAPIRGDCPESEPAITRPDLANLYHEAVAAAGDDSALTSCPAGTVGDSLDAMLNRRYGAEAVHAERLAGPFSLPDWQGGTVLTAFPEDGGLPSVLVAEREELTHCCLHLDAPRDPSLQVFTWSVGSLFVVEISPLDRPRFLDSFEVAALDRRN